MNKIIPVLSLIVAVLGAALAATGLAALAIGVNSGALGVSALALPFVVIGTVVSGASAVITFFFKRDRLCFIAFFINIGGVALSLASIITWFAAL